MRRKGLFWGIVILLIGALMLLTNLGMLPGSVWRYFFPLMLIAAGLYVLFGRGWLRPNPNERVTEIESLSLPLAGARQADIRIKHGAGSLTVRSGAAPANILEGEFSAGVQHEVEDQQGMLKVELEAPSLFMLPPMWDYGHAWDVRLNAAVPLRLRLKTGADQTDLDLTDLNVTELEIDTGASANRVRLPANAGFTKVDIDGGATSIALTVPLGVAAHIRLDGGAAGFEVDTTRFHRVGGYYESSDYATAANRVEIKADIGAGSIKVF
ncbi:MAG: hypothetical protein HPY76_12890 [Anaerolineae bacterium]|nr:hypothetical protein [Anaerolineae bacterium]